MALVVKVNTVVEALRLRHKSASLFLDRCSLCPTTVLKFLTFYSNISDTEAQQLVDALDGNETLHQLGECSSYSIF